jgi:hypothetical protein
LPFTLFPKGGDSQQDKALLTVEHQRRKPMTVAWLRRFGVVGVVVALFLATNASAWAAQPEIVRFQAQGVDPHLVNCGTFFINGQFAEQGSVTTFVDDAGNPVRLKVQVVFNGQLTNETTGQTLRDAPRYTVFVDVQTGTVTYVGLPVHWTIPGVGNIILDAGRIVFDPTTGEVVFEAGPHPVFHLTGEETQALLCAALASS